MSDTGRELPSLLGFLGHCFQQVSSIAKAEALALECDQHVATNQRLTAVEQVDIYRRQYWLRHLDSLREDYIALARVMGEVAFEAFATSYLKAFPPSTPSLRDLGANIERFAQTYDEFPPEQRELLLELLSYEHAFIDLFDAADVPPLAPDRLQNLGETGLLTARLVLSPLLVRRKFSYPVHKIRFAAKAGDSVDGLLSQSDVCLLLFRLDGTIRVDELDPLAFRILDEIARERSLLAACEQVLKRCSPTEQQTLSRELSGWFQRWSQWGLIVDVVQE